MSINYSNSFEESVVTSSAILPEDAGEGSLRPKTITEYIGQEKAKDNLSVFIEAARKNELIGTWTPKAGEDICLFHSTEDDMVPFVNSALMGEALKSTDCRLEEVFGGFGDHIQGLAIFILSVSGYFAQAD